MPGVPRERSSRAADPLPRRAATDVSSGGRRDTPQIQLFCAGRRLFLTCESHITYTPRGSRWDEVGDKGVKTSKGGTFQCSLGGLTTLSTRKGGSVFRPSSVTCCSATRGSWSLRTPSTDNVASTFIHRRSGRSFSTNF